MKRAKLVVFCGPDSVGKSTQAELMRKYFAEERGLKTRLFKLPFNDKVTHRIIYGMLFNGLARKHPSLFQFMQFINKLVFQLFVLSWALFTNDVIILDRWVMSAQVYGDADGAHPFITRTMNRVLAKADATILMLGTKHVRPGRQDSYESDDDYQGRVLELYQSYEGFKNVVSYTNSKRKTPEDVSATVLISLWEREALNDDEVRGWAKVVYGVVPSFVDEYIFMRKPAVIPYTPINQRLVSFATEPTEITTIDGTPPRELPPRSVYTDDLEDIVIGEGMTISKHLIVAALKDETPDELTQVAFARVPRNPMGKSLEEVILKFDKQTGVVTQTDKKVS